MSYFAILLTCLLSGWAVTDSVNDYKSDKDKFIQTGSVTFWLSRTGVVLIHMLLIYILFQSR